MSNKINIVRPDGTVTQATEEQFRKLEKLGYKREDIGSAVERATGEANEEYYTSTGQQVLTGLEGLASGATVGLIDPLLEDNATRKRAEYNPGVRVGAEIVGGVGAAIAIPGSPAGLLARGATAVGKAAGGGVRGLAVAGAVEGAAAGIGQSITRATLDNSPLTADSVLAGAGWGAVFGAGIGAGLGKVSSVAASKIDEASKYVNPIKEEEFFRLRNTIDELQSTSKTISERGSAARGSAKAYTDELKRLDDELGTLEKTHDTLVKTSTKEFDTSFKALNKEYESAKNAVNRAPTQSNKDALTEIENRIFRMKDVQAARLAGSEAETLARREVLSGNRVVVQGELSKAQKAAERLTIHSNALKELEKLPKTAEAFVNMERGKAERIFGAMDALMQKSDDDLVHLRESLAGATEALIAKTGIVVESSNPVEKLRKIYTIAKESAKEEVFSQMKKAVERGDTSANFMSRVAKQAAARGASSAARGAGAGAVGSSFAYQAGAYLTGGLAGVVSEISGIRAAVQQRMAKAVARLNPSKSKVVRHTVPRIEPLTVGLLGGIDKENKTKSRTELAEIRARELASVTGNVKEVMYNSISPLIGEHADFANTLHTQGVSKFSTLLEMIPRDPGTSFNNMRSMWKPNPVQTEQFSRIMQVFHFPLDVIDDFMDDIANIDPIRADAMKKLWPDIYNELRLGVLEKLPEMGELDYFNQARLANLLDLDLHSSFTSQAIAARQAHFMEVPEENAMGSKSPNPAGRSGGRPPSSEPPTPGQSLLTR